MHRVLCADLPCTLNGAAFKALREGSVILQVTSSLLRHNLQEGPSLPSCSSLEVEPSVPPFLGPVLCRVGSCPQGGSAELQPRLRSGSAAPGLMVLPLRSLVPLGKKFELCSGN